MTKEPKTPGQWRRVTALCIAALLALAALVGMRGPDSLGTGAVQTTGSWLLSGPSLWHPLAPEGSTSRLLFTLAGPRGWQNAHVVIAWLSLVCWLIALPPKSWRGLLPVIPALLAAVLSTPASGLSGFGLAILMLSAARTLSLGRTPLTGVGSLPLAAWMAVWLSPGALFLVGASVLEASTRLPRRHLAATAALCFAAVNLTPRGTSVWLDGWIYFLWSPQAAPDGAAVIALLASLVMLALAARASWNTSTTGRVLAPVFLILCATQGQTSFLWAAALMMIPCWPAAKEQLSHLGFKVRWWMQASMVAGSIALAVWPGVAAVPRWYNLAMNSAVVQPTLTRLALPQEGEIYINPAGLPVARFGGQPPVGAGNGGAGQALGREPGLWRAEDRRMRFRAVWLLGDKSDYAPLARHLGGSADWQLAAVDATGLLFERRPKSGVFATEPAQQLARTMTGGANRSGFLSASALACLAAGSITESGELSATAVRRSDQSSVAAATRALVLISLGQVRDALEESLRAVRLDPSSAEAWRVRTEALLHGGLADDAYAAGQQAVRFAPGEAGTLWLAARAANAARAFQSESEILERLISLTEGRRGDAGFYHFYLGQSYAKQGLRRPALWAFENAAKAPGLTDDQRRQIHEEMDLIKPPAAR